MFIFRDFFPLSCPYGQESFDRYGNKVCLDPGSKCAGIDAVTGVCLKSPTDVCSDENGCIQTVIVGDKNFIIIIFVSFIIMFCKYLFFYFLIANNLSFV
jgi:hypothetical protein